MGVLTGIWTAQYEGHERKLTIDPYGPLPKGEFIGEFTGTLESTIDGIVTSFPLKGTYARWEQNHGRTLFALSGASSAVGKRLVWSCVSITGHGEHTGEDRPPASLQIVSSWAEDKNSNDADNRSMGSWTFALDPASTVEVE